MKKDRARVTRYFGRLCGMAPDLCVKVYSCTGYAGRHRGGTFELLSGVQIQAQHAFTKPEIAAAMCVAKHIALTEEEILAVREKLAQLEFHLASLRKMVVST